MPLYFGNYTPAGVPGAAWSYPGRREALAEAAAQRLGLAIRPTALTGYGELESSLHRAAAPYSNLLSC